MTKKLWKKYSYAWLTLAFFLFSIAGHWIFGWLSYVDEQKSHQQPIDVSSYMIDMAAATFENWQSEFLQLLWQVGGLALFIYYGSPQSKEGEERKEEKIDAILRLLSPEDGEKIIKKLDKKYFPEETKRES